MSRKPLFVLASLAGISLVTGCTNSVVVPRSVDGRWLHNSSELSGPCGLDRSGTRLRMPRDGQDLMIGILNRLDRGPDPVPCVRLKQWRYVNSIRWDLRHAVVQVFLDRGATLQRAEIEARFVPIGNEWAGVWEGSLAEVRLATQRAGGPVRERHDRDPGVLTALAPLPDAPWSIRHSPGGVQWTETYDATNLVRRWMAESIANHGIVFNSSEFGLGDEVVERDVVYGAHVRLVLYFNEP